MARKKNRPLPSHPVAASAGAITTAPSPAPAAAPLPRPTAGPTTFRQTAAGQTLVTLFKVASSLQLAIVLLIFFAASMILGTLIESRYSADIAGHTVYGSWWFVLLLILLAVNIACAALKKMDLAKLRAWQWPWKKYQTGFLVTHLGLLTLLFGGFLSGLFGVDGQMVMIDTPNKQLQGEIGIADQTNVIHLYNKHQLDVFKLQKSATPKTAELISLIRKGEEVPPHLKDQLKGQWTTYFNPGPFSWYDDPEKGYKVKLPTELALLNVLAAPAPGHSANLDNGLGVRVTNFYSHTESWRYSPAGKDDRSTFAAIQLRLSSPNFGKDSINRWLVDRIDIQGQANLLDFLLLTAPDPVVVPEFTNPPQPKDMGKDGQLVLYIDGKPHRIAVDRQKLNQPVTLEGTDATVTVLSVGNLAEEVARLQRLDIPAEELALYPSVTFRVSRNGEQEDYMLSARGPSVMAVSTSRQESHARPPVRFSGWYHYPDFRWGAPEAAVKGAVQFLLLPNDRLFCRVFGADGLREQGFEVNPANSETVYDLPFREPMKMSFQIGAFMPRATEKASFMPRNRRPGSEMSSNYQPAIRGQLQVGRETKDFWARMDTSPTMIEAGGELYMVRYRPARIVPDFTVTLHKATALKDPGSDRPSAYQSDVSVQPKGQAEPRKESVYMNHTVDVGGVDLGLMHLGGFRLFQANFEQMKYESGNVVKDGNRPVNKTGLSARHDPGKPFVYIGFMVAALGIAIMFWMKAYFFKPRGRRAADEEAVANEVVIP